MRNVSTACPLCGGFSAVELYRHRGRIVRCERCTLVRRDPLPDLDEIARIYRAPDYFRLDRHDAIGYADYFADESIFRPYFARTFALLKRYVTPPGRLVEVGAAAGFALIEAERAGWSAEGLELSPGAVAFARGRGLAVREGGFDDLPRDASADVVAAFQTIEHVADVRAAIQRVRVALRPGGTLLLTTPDHGSLLRSLMRRFWIAYRPEHLLYFDRRTLSELLGSEGFSVSHVGPDSRLRVPMARLVERATHYWTSWRIDERRLPRVTIPVSLGDMIIVARKSG